MLDKKFYQITLAIAGILQAAWLVESLATTGQTDQNMLATQLRSIIATEPKDFISIYGKEANLTKGLTLVKTIFDPQYGRSNPNAMHYLMALIYLQDRLRRDTVMLNKISQQLAKLPHRLQHFDILHPSIVDNFAEIYLTTIACYRYRIQVVGKQLFLEQENIISLIRALLLSGVRSAILWRQVGGSRMQFIFSRKKLVTQATQLLNSVTS